MEQVRKDLVDIVKSLSRFKSNGLKTIAITTNGLTLHRRIEELKNSGESANHVTINDI